MLRRFANAPVLWIDKSVTGWLLTKTVRLEVFGPKSAVKAFGLIDLATSASGPSSLEMAM